MGPSPSSPSSSPAALAAFPERYARTGRFTAGAPRTFTVASGGDRVLFCRSTAGDDPVLALWSLDPATGVESVVFDPARGGAAVDGDLPAAERARRERARESASGVVAYSVDAGATTVCFAVAGSLFVTDLTTGVTRTPEVEGSVFDPRLSPDGSAIAYVDGRALRVVAADDGRPLVTRLDDDPLVSHGRAEFVAAEEMGRSRGHWWAPDSSALVVARVDESPVDEWWIADPAHPDRAPNRVRYPAAGTANAAVTLELVTIAGEVSPLVWDDDGHFEYLADVVWTTGREPVAVRQTRDQRLVSIATLDPTGGPPTELRAVTDDVWVELFPGSPRLDPTLLTIEDTGGGRRLCGPAGPLTDAAVVVRSLIGTAPGADASGDASAAVVAAHRSPTEIGLLAVALDGASAEPRACWLTPPGGVHSAVMGGDVVVVTAAHPDRSGTRTTVHRLDPTVLESALAGADPQAEPPTVDALGPGITVEGHRAPAPFPAAPTFTTLGPRELPSAVFLPTWHDGTTPLPVLLDPYGGPHAQRVLSAHDPHLVSRWLAEHGYAVIVTDGRGTPGRGPAWEREVYGDLAGPVLDDQVSALEAACDHYDVLDPDRVGIRGWSFGGYLAALAVLRRPDRFHAAVAGAPVTTWHLYDTHYTERYLGHPDADPEHYRTSDLFAPGRPLELERPLLLIHGLADDNVVAAHTLRFSTELLAGGCAHQVLPLSGVTHMTPQEAVASNLLRLQLDFFDRALAPDRPWGTATAADRSDGGASDGMPTA